jgi:hypothetical protein
MVLLMVESCHLGFPLGDVELSSIPTKGEILPFLAGLQ